MGQGLYAGLVWGVKEGDDPKVIEALQAPRNRKTLRPLRKGTFGSPLWAFSYLDVDTRRPSIKAASESKTWWCGMPVAVTPNMASHWDCREIAYTALDLEAARTVFVPDILRAQAAWIAFRDFCRRADTDPGPGRLLLILDRD